MIRYDIMIYIAEMSSVLIEASVRSNGSFTTESLEITDVYVPFTSLSE